MSQRAPPRLRQLAWISLGPAAFLLALIIVTTIYQRVATVNEQVRFPPPGRLVDVGGYRLHLRCEGQGSPTVVLESGCGMTSNEWTLVQPEVARFTRVCSYDRAGLGWSESGPPTDPGQRTTRCCEMEKSLDPMRSPDTRMDPVSPAGLPIVFHTKSREWC